MARHKKTYSGERFTVKRTLQLTPSQAAELDAGAEQRRVRWSDFTRELLFRRFAEAGKVAGTRRDPQGAAVLRELNALGINLNQLMRHGHQTGELGEQRLSEVDDVLLAIKRAAGRVYSL
jgi:hypothetical protein